GDYPRSEQSFVNDGDSDTGGASRFFPIFRYEAKAGSAERPRIEPGDSEPAVRRCGRCDRLISNAGPLRCRCSDPAVVVAPPRQIAHPTVKPVDLMRWLVRLVTPPG